MKFPIEWLKEVLPLKVKDADAIELLTNIGLEVEYSDKDIIDISIPANRADCASIFGIARELSAAIHEDLHLPEVIAIEPDHEMSLHVKVEETRKCPRYISRIISNVNAKAQTPDFIRNRLTLAGFRCVSIIVDLTNYVMLETGQPLHAFDLSQIAGKLVVRNAAAGEEIELLDDSKHVLTSDDLVIADDVKILALAGIMGGKNSGISLDTTNVVLECAYFEPLTVRATSKRFKVQTEGSFRFERGVCPNMQSDVLKRLTSLILQYAGGQPSITNHFKDKSNLPQPLTIVLRGTRVTTVLGQNFESNEIIDILTSLGFICTLISPREISVNVPSFRVDVTQEIDLIEEIVRIYGLNKITPKPPKSELIFKKHPSTAIDLFTIQNVLMSLGYAQTINYSFISPALHQLFFQDSAKIELVNPISADLSIMRSSLVLSLLKVLQYNQNRQIRANLSLKIFETGLKFVKNKDKTEQTMVVAGATYGRLFPKNWADSNQSMDFFDIKQDIVNLCKLSNLENAIELRPIISQQGMHPVKTAAIFLNSQQIGFVGAIHPEIINQLELKSEVFCFEIELTALQNGGKRVFKSFSKYPAISRDMALLADNNIPVSRIKSLINDFCGILLKDIIVFDLFVSKDIPENKKSLALSLIFQDDQQTLNVEVVNDLFKRLIDELQSKLGLELRQQ